MMDMFLGKSGAHESLVRLSRNVQYPVPGISRQTFPISRYVQVVKFLSKHGVKMWMSRHRFSQAGETDRV